MDGYEVFVHEVSFFVTPVWINAPMGDSRLQGL